MRHFAELVLYFSVKKSPQTMLLSMKQKLFHSEKFSYALQRSKEQRLLIGLRMLYEAVRTDRSFYQSRLFTTQFKPDLSSSSQWRTCILVSILRLRTARRMFHVTSLFYPFTDFTLRYLKSPYIQMGLTVSTKDLDGSFVYSVLSRTSTRRFHCFGLLCLSCRHAQHH